MATLDLILLVCFAPGIVSGLSKGFVRQFVDLASIFIGAWAAFKFAGTIGNWLSTYLTLDPTVLYVICFALIIVLASLLLNILGRLVCSALTIASLGWLNKLGGLAAGILKTALIIGLLIMIFEGLNGKWHMVKPEFFDNSPFYCFLRDTALKVFPYLKSMIVEGGITPQANV